MLKSQAIWRGPSLVIDTNSYAGNFERELTAFVTGFIDEERATKYIKSMVDIFRKEVGENNPFENLLTWGLECLGDIPGETVCSLYPTPGIGNDGHGNYYQTNSETPSEYPAYFSVRFFLSREPNAEELDLIKKRTERFAVQVVEFKQPFRITGYRLVYEKVVIEEKQI